MQSSPAQLVSLISQLDLNLLSPPLEAGITGWLAAMPTRNVRGSGDLKSGPVVCKAIVLTIESSLQPQFHHFKCHPSPGLDLLSRLQLSNECPHVAT